MNWNWKLFFVTLSRLFVLQMAMGKTTSTAKNSNEKFALKLSTALGLEKPHENVIISPILLQAALTLLYYGSSDQTTIELRNALHLQSFSNKQAAITNIAELLSSTKSEARNKAFLASGIYVQERLTFDLKKDFKEIAQQFDILTERRNFCKDQEALDNINFWFLTQTNFTIGQVVPSTALHENLQFLLASAIAFKSPWAKGFDVKETEKLNFHSDQSNYKSVDSMFVTEKFQYAEMTHLDAKAIELPFEGSNLKMLIMYPNQIDGLRTLEAKLQYEDLSRLIREMSERKVALTLPKFHVEFNADLKSVLSNLGLTNIFGTSVSFQNMFSSLFSALAPHVNSVQHKAVLEIDESGELSETGFSFGNLFKRSTQLVISHPFYFAIRTDEAILLAGHIVNVV